MKKKKKKDDDQTGSILKDLQKNIPSPSIGNEVEEEDEEELEKRMKKINTKDWRTKDSAIVTGGN